jgi:hypothetical protein
VNGFSNLASFYFNSTLVRFQPDEWVVYAVKFDIGMTVCLSCLEAAHMAFLHCWNSEIFVVISSLITFVSGIIIGHKVT